MTGRGLVTIATALAALSACKVGASKDPTHALPYAESWCPEGFEAGPNDTCFAIPERPAKDAPVLVFLHGTYAGAQQPAEWGALRVALDRGFAVVLPRGKRGMCAFRAELSDHFCWPEDPDDVETTRGLVHEWERVLWQVEALLEDGTKRRYVLGSAEGGAFASYLATRGLFQGHGYAIVHGGAMAPPDPSHAVPLLLVASEQAPESSAKARELHQQLTAARWPHAYCPRPGEAVLTERDVEAALRFFERDLNGTLAAHGASYPCEAPPPR